MKQILQLSILLSGMSLMAQGTDRYEQLSQSLDSATVEIPGLLQRVDMDFNVNGVPLDNFLLALSELHQVNIHVDPSLETYNLKQNFNQVPLRDVLLFLCREYGLNLDIVGNILSLSAHVPKTNLPYPILVEYEPMNDMISIDVKNNALEQVLRKIMDETGRNLLYNPRMQDFKVSLYLKDLPFEVAMENLAKLNGMKLTRSKEGYFLFDAAHRWYGSGKTALQSTPDAPTTLNGFYFEVLDFDKRELSVDFEQVPIETIVQVLTSELGLDYYLAPSPQGMGSATIRMERVHFDDLLSRILESDDVVSQTGTLIGNPELGTNLPRGSEEFKEEPINYTFKREGDLYLFGTELQLGTRDFDVIRLMNRSVELLADPLTMGRQQGLISDLVDDTGGLARGSNLVPTFQSSNGGLGVRERTPNGGSELNTGVVGNFGTISEALVNLLPSELLDGLEIRVDFEMNSFVVSGPASKIKRFKGFIKAIDEPVPVVLIEVMLIEVLKSATVETGISWGLGDKPTRTSGSLFPNLDLSLGSKNINRIIGGFDGFGSFNIGKVVPEFYASIKAMEENGNIKIRSTPKLSTLSGHRASLSIGETTYYVVTRQSFIGSQVPTTSEIRNYLPINAELAISIKPLVSGNGQITLDTYVVQSDFSGERIEEEAPPGMTSREFSSIIRMQNQDVAVLGGLEEKIKRDTGKGVPLLSRIPVLKWLFSTRSREDTNKKLTILIKPTVIY